jgi:hypothetical protein
MTGRVLLLGPFRARYEAAVTHEVSGPKHRDDGCNSIRGEVTTIIEKLT